MDIRDIQQKRANLWEEAKKFLDEHTDKDGKISAEDAAAYEKMENDIVELGKQIDRLKRQETLNAELNALSGTPMLLNPNGTGDSKDGRASDAYRKAAIKAVRTGCRFITNDLATDPDSAGGFLVPTEWDTRLIKSLEEENVIRTLGTVITTASEHKINRVATKPAAAWLDEGASINFGNGTFAQITLDAHKVGIGILISEELIADSMFDIETEILDQFSKAIANAEEDAFINGAPDATTGKVSRPTGIITTISGISTAYIETATAGAAPTADNIVDLTHKLPRPYRKNAAFLLNDATLATIKKFKDQTQRYLWEPSYQAGEPDRLLGYPVYTSSYMPVIASGNFPILFGDFSYYNIADRGTRTIQELKEAYAVSGQVGFLMKERVDGILVDNDAMRAIKIK